MPSLSSPALEVVRANARRLLADALESIRRKDPYEQTGRPYVEAAWLYRRMAICELLADAHVEGFCAHLYRSAQLRIHFLRLASEGLPADRAYLCASKNFSFVDALVAGHMKSALEIAHLAPPHHDPSCEYEEDFLLHHFLHTFTIHLGTGASHDFQPLLDRWQRALQGEASCHLKLCQALVHGDELHFHESLQEAIAQRQQVFEERKADPGFKDTLLTESFLYMTGLAFLRLAELCGLSLTEEYPTAPSLARVPQSLAPLKDDSWLSPPAS